MQKTENHARLFYPSATGKFFWLGILFLILTGATLRAGEPAMTLAMKQSPGKNSSTARSHLFSDTNKISFDLKRAKPKVQAPAVFSSGGEIEIQSNSVPGEPFLLVREDFHSIKPLTIQAGYGQIWDDKSTLQKICSDHQEPGCAYVSANFSF